MERKTQCMPSDDHASIARFFPCAQQPLRLHEPFQSNESLVLNRPNFHSGAPKPFAIAGQIHRARSPEAVSNLRKPDSEYQTRDQSVKREQLRRASRRDGPFPITRFCDGCVTQEGSLTQKPISPRITQIKGKHAFFTFF